MQNLNVLRLIIFSSFRRFEQFSYLLFLKRLDDRENAAERQTKVKYFEPAVFPEVVNLLSLQEEFAGVVARVELLRGRNSAFEPREAGRQVNGLFESLLAESFGGG